NTYTQKPTIGRVATKRACFIDIVCYESNSKGKSQAGERSSNRVLQEKSSNGVKKNMNRKTDRYITMGKIRKGRNESGEGDKANVWIRVKQVMTENPSEISKSKELETLLYPYEKI
ncbi:40764_t:CDS:2, partial [Gigaspora margarita]